MSLVADFRVFNDHSQHLKAGQQTVFRVEIPVNLDHTADSSKSVVYLKYSLEGASSLKWELFLNGTLLLWTTSSGSKISMTMEAFEAKLLLPGENEFVFRVPSGTGTVRVADATVHYHVNV